MAVDGTPPGRPNPSAPQTTEETVQTTSASVIGETKSRPLELTDLDTTIVAEDNPVPTVRQHNPTPAKNESGLLPTHSQKDPTPLSSHSQPEHPETQLGPTTHSTLHTAESDTKDISYDADITQDATFVAAEPIQPKDADKQHEGDDNPDDDPEARFSQPNARSQHPASRPHNLELNLKPPSPQPWDLAETEFVHVKGPGLSIPVSAGAYSPVASQKFSVMQAAVGNGRPLVPKSSYYFGPPPLDSAYGTPPVGQIGVHHPREIIRVERDYTGGEIIQFAPIYPLELENRLTPTQFLESINTMNEILISAHSLRHAFWDNLVTVATFQLSRLFLSTHFQKEMKRLQRVIDDLNVMLYNPVGLNILWPGSVAFLFLEIEYY